MGSVRFTRKFPFVCAVCRGSLWLQYVIWEVVCGQGSTAQSKEVRKEFGLVSSQRSHRTITKRALLYLLGDAVPCA